MVVESADVLGVRVDLVSMADVLAFVEESIRERRPARIVTVNAEYVIRARRDGEFAAVLRSADLATADGAGVVWAMRRFGAQQRERVGGSDLIWLLAEQAARNHHRIFLLGGAPGVADRAADVLRGRYPGLLIAGTYAGSPAEAEEEHIVDLIRRSQADVLLVAFGAPAQDKWLASHLSETGAHVGMGVGGSFDYVAGVARRAPVWMQRRGLEWLWRLIRQPRRWRRMLALPLFVWWTLREMAVDRGERAS
jgi:N-acetylglucosaminyldiphosphoundecaprenol N-acetyl-beta-D-mannosaminyltransferase